MKKIWSIVLVLMVILNVAIINTVEVNGLDDGWHSKIENQSMVLESSMIEGADIDISPLGLDDGWHS